MIRLRQLWNSEKKLSDYIKEYNPKKILLPFGHGLGDTILFMNPFDKLSSLYPSIEFTLVLQKNLGFEDLEKGIIGDNRKVIFSSDLSYKEEASEYDIVADIDMPMSESQVEFTKGEWCCIHELGIEPISGHKFLKNVMNANRLVGLHFQITCLPDSANVPYEVAKKIWNEIKEAGFIPMETLMPHIFHNPKNEKYDFIDRHIRDIPPKIPTLAGVIQSCGFFICGVSGNFHLALSLLPPERICLLERDFLAPSFTKLPIKRIDIKDYKEGSIKEWLGKL